jgi:hypothetical protein
MTKQDSRLARVCAELIRLWHEHYGTNQRPSNMDGEQFSRYSDRVEHFHKADLSDPGSQEGIAKEQQSGFFEWHYGAVVPVELWKHLAQKYKLVDQRPPKHLGEAANWILERLRSAEGEESRAEESHRMVQAETQGKLFEQAKEFYADVVAEQTQNVGGINVLLSCSLERYPWQVLTGHRTTLLRPEALGLQLVANGERRDNLVDALRKGDLVMESVVGGPAKPISTPHRDDESAG